MRAWVGAWVGGSVWLSRSCAFWLSGALTALCGRLPLWLSVSLCLISVSYVPASFVFSPPLEERVSVVSKGAVPERAFLEEVCSAAWAVVRHVFVLVVRLLPLNGHCFLGQRAVAAFKVCLGASR